MKVVLDTNCVLQIVFPQSYHKEVWEALVAQKYTICITNEILLEYREILERRTGSALFAEEVIEAILLCLIPNACLLLFILISSLLIRMTISL